jgi:hypothetical protein
MVVFLLDAYHKHEAISHSAYDREQRVAKATQFLRREDVTTIEGEGGLEHAFLDFCVIEMGEFIPLGHDRQGMSLMERCVWVIDDFKVVE